MWTALFRTPWLRRLLRSERGSIAVLGALSLTSVIAMCSLAVEMGAGYAAKVRNQRVADMAALGAAMAYQASSQSLSTATATARDIVVANGLTITPDVTQVTLNGQSAIKVVITTTQPIGLLRTSPTKVSYDVSSAAYASLTGNATPACILALSNSSSSVTATGGAGVSASGCAITSNGTISSDNSSAKVTAKQITAATISDTSGQGITTTPTASNIRTQANAASDTIKTSSQVQTALCYVNQLSGYSDPDYSGGNRSCTNQKVTPVVPANNGSGDWTLTYEARSKGGIYAYQTADYSCNYVIPAGNYNIRTLTVSGGCSISVAGGSTLAAQSIDMSGARMTIGDGNVTISGTFKVNGDNTVTFGAGKHIFGQLDIGGGKSLTLGAGDLIVGKQITLSGGAFLKANISAGNVVTIGSDGASTPVAVTVSGGSQLCFTSDCGAPTAAAGTFSADGAVRNDGGGSLIVFPDAAIHVINGDLALSSSAIFGDGLYVVRGNWTNGTGGSMQGTNVTFALGGSFSFAGGTSFDVSAPSSGSYGIVDTLIVTKTSSATSISAGANGKAGGLIYAPNSALSSSGGSSISSNGSACMMLVVNSVAVSGSGTVNTANCSSFSSGATGTVSLLQ